MADEGESVRTPQSRRAADPLGLALFGLLRNEGEAGKRLVLAALDAADHITTSERAQLVLDALLRCELETNHERLSKQRYETWRRDHPDKSSIPSATFVANTFGATWAKAMDAAGLELALDHRIRQLRAVGPSPSDDDTLAALRECATALAQETITFDDYRRWARGELERTNGARPLIISTASFLSRFGSFARARLLAGLSEPYGRGGPKGTREEYADLTLDGLRECAREIGEPPGVADYHEWRARRLVEARAAGEHLPLPGYKSIQRAFGSWPQALRAAGVLTDEQAARYARGRGQKASPRHVAESLLAALRASEAPLTQDRYCDWRKAGGRSVGSARAISETPIIARFGTWSRAVAAANAALSTEDPVQALAATIDEKG